MGTPTCKHQTTTSRQFMDCLRCKSVSLADGSQYEVQSDSSDGWSCNQEKIRSTDPKAIHRRIWTQQKSSNRHILRENRLFSKHITDKMPKGKRALLCGVSYKKQNYELKGIGWDVKNMKDLLVGTFHFPVESILILAEEEHCLPPTRENIEAGFRWLVGGIQYGDSLVFYFSGHGLRQRDLLRDEIDAFDETICPVDFETKGMILDNDINQAIVRRLITGVKLHAIVDSCHSGTVLDLSHTYNKRTGKWDDNRPPSGAEKGTGGGTAICFSACEDYQLAADTSDFSKAKEVSGAMTYAFIRSIKDKFRNNQTITYLGILQSMHAQLNQVKQQGCFRAGMQRVFHRRILQDPLLTSSNAFDVNRVFNL